LLGKSRLLIYIHIYIIARKAVEQIFPPRPKTQDPKPKTQDPRSKIQIGNNSPQKSPVFSRNSTSDISQTTEKPQNQLVEPEGKIPQLLKNAEKQAFSSSPANRILAQSGIIRCAVVGATIHRE
jgi:hypothetical protein